MRPDEYARLAAFETGYWWFVGKRQLVAQCIKPYLPAPASRPCILDVGCGTGAMLGQHKRRSPLAFGVDFSPLALKYSAGCCRGYLSQASILHIPVASNSFDLVTCLDVLYHQWVIDDKVVLTEMYRVIKPGGLLILTDSAFAFLQGPHDAVNLTARRYTLPQLESKLVKVGFSIEKQSYVFALLFPIALIRRWFQRTLAKSKEPASDIQPLYPWLNRLLLQLFQVELAWLKVSRVPWGTSVLFVARK